MQQNLLSRTRLTVQQDLMIHDTSVFTPQNLGFSSTSTSNTTLPSCGLEVE